jgi:hypothetical protein
MTTTPSRAPAAPDDSRREPSTKKVTSLRQRARSRLRLVFGAAVLPVVVVAGLATTATPAFATVRYYSTSSSLNLRAGPGTTWGSVQTVGYHAALDIDCQVQGATNIGGNATWDHLTNGLWVTDYYTTSPSFNSYAPGLGPCSREWRSAAWASAQVGNTGYNGWCELFVERSYGTSGRYGSALADFYAQRSAGQIHYDTNPPVGALVFYRNPFDGGNGHVEISRGNGSYVTTGSSVQIVGFGWGGSFMGWSYAPSNWPGR